MVLCAGGDLHGVPDGDAIGDQDEEFDACLDGLDGCALDEACRDEDDGDVDVAPGVLAGVGHGVGDGVEDGNALDLLACLSGCAAGDDIGAIAQHEAGACLALAAGDALNEDASGFVDEDGHGCVRVRGSGAKGR